VDKINSLFYYLDIISLLLARVLENIHYFDKCFSNRDPRLEVSQKGVIKVKKRRKDGIEPFKQRKYI